jgi:PAS domain S-box-containing protein
MIPAMASPGQESESLNVQFLVDSMLAMVHTARPGHLDYFNKRWLEYLGVTLDDVSGWKWRAFVHREDVEGTAAKWRARVETGENFEFETGVPGADGEYCWMLHRKMSLRDRRGNNCHVKKFSR